HISFLSTMPQQPRPTLFPYTTLFRSAALRGTGRRGGTPEYGTSGPCPAPGQLFDPTCRGDVRESQPARRSHQPDGVQARSQFERSEEHTSELQSRENLVCRLLLEKKN